MNTPPRQSLSVVIPAYRESIGIANAIEVIERMVAEQVERYEIIVVDDGSPDDTFTRVEQIAARNPHVRGLRLSRNFGKEAALLAGLRCAVHEAVITIDADLQHPPALIPQMIHAWREGAVVVNAVKRDRGDEGPFARWRAHLFNAMLDALGGVNLRNSSDFKLLDRQAVEVIIGLLPERKRFYRGLTGWIGFKQKNLEFDVDARRAGQSSWSIGSLARLALTAIVSFTSAPLRLVTILGLLVLLVGGVIAIETLWSWAHGRAVSGFATLIMTLLILGSMIMISLGIIGEYIAKMYEEIKGRPNYLVSSTCGLPAARAEPAAHTPPAAAITPEGVNPSRYLDAGG